jgi:translation elongation factor EF-Tu-like GTPase
LRFQAQVYILTREEGLYPFNNGIISSLSFAITGRGTVATGKIETFATEALAAGENDSFEIELSVPIWMEPGFRFCHS